MDLQVNIICDKSEQEFASLIEKSLLEVISKNDKNVVSFTHSNSPANINIIINQFEEKLLNNGKTNILINTKEPIHTSFSGYKEVDFYEKDIDGVFHSLNDINNKLFWLKVYDVITLLENQVTERFVYLAPCEVDQSNNRDIIKRELIKQGFAVIPENNHKQSKNEAITDIERSEFSVHVLDEEFGTENSICEYYNKIAADHVSNKYKNYEISHQLRFIWISPDIRFVDETQLLHLEKFRQDIEALKGSEIVQTPIELFKNLLKKRMSGEVKSNAPLNVEDFLYLIHEPNDEIDKISASLNEVNIKFETPNYTPTSQSLIEQHRSKLVKANGILIYGINKNPNWVNSKIKDIKKAPGFGRKNAFKQVAIWVNNKEKFKAFSNTVNLIEADNNQAFNEFIKSLKNNE